MPLPDDRTPTPTPEARLARAPGDALLELDADGVLGPIDPRALELFGLSGDEADALLAVAPADRMGALVAAATHAVADPETFAVAMRRAAEAGEEVTFDELELRDARVLEWYGAPAGAPGRRGRVFSLRDVTRRRRAMFEVRDRARQQEAVADLGELAMNAETLDPLLQAATRIVAQVLDVDLVHLLQLDASGETLRIRARNVELSGAGPDVVSRGESLSGYTLAHQAPVVVLDLATEARVCAPRLRALSVVSAISVVVRGRDRAFGVLGAYGLRRRAFTTDEVHFVETVANVLAATVARSTAEATLLDRERQLRAVFENALDAMVTFDDEGRVVEVNAAGIRLFGHTRAELLGRAAPTLFGSGARQAAEAWRELRARGRLSGELQVEPPGAAPRQVEFAALAGILPGLHLATLRDVTEQRTMRSRLAIADRMASVGTLAAGVAHELNNPLSYVTANLSWVLERLAEAPALAPADAREEVREALAEARDGTDRMRDIIRDLRTFSRVDETRSGPVEVAPVVESCVNMAWNEIRHRAQLARDFGEVPPVHGNEARLGQVLLNLLVNAAQAIPEGAADRNEIRVAIGRAHDGRVSVAVSDTGCGIAPENRQRVFDPFFTTKPLGVGTGLGLSICHNLVAAMGGAIELESEVGRGSTFRVLLPAWCGEQAPQAAAPPRSSVRRRGRVLVVDDEPFVGAAVRRALAPDHDVTVVCGAREALARLGAGERWDVVVSDLLMPDMTGIDLRRELAALDEGLAQRMIFVTGGAFTPATRAFVEEHRASCLEKPFELDALRDLVRRRVFDRAA